MTKRKLKTLKKLASEAASTLQVTAQPKPTPLSLQAMQKGVNTLDDLMAVSIGAMEDILTNAISTSQANALATHAGKILKGTELRHRHGSTMMNRASLPLAQN